jgi:hypothetical protein
MKEHSPADLSADRYLVQALPKAAMILHPGKMPSGMEVHGW